MFELKMFGSECVALCLGPYLERAVPAARGDGRAVGRHLEAGHAILVAVQHGNAVRLQHVPHVHRVVIVAYTQA